MSTHRAQLHLQHKHCALERAHLLTEYLTCACVFDEVKNSSEDAKAFHFKALESQLEPRIVALRAKHLAGL